MAISYPITLPSKPAPSRFSIEPASFSVMTQSPWTASQQVQLSPGQMWSISIDLPPMSESQARDWMAAVLSLRGQFGTVLLGNPTMKTPRGNWGQAPVINGSGQTGSQLQISGLPAGGRLRAGDFFQLGSGATSRLYTLLEDAEADGAGAASATIWPNLRTATTSGAAITTNLPRGVFRSAAPSLSLQFEPFRYGLSLQFVEAVS
jgi:hypothetical protein